MQKVKFQQTGASDFYKAVTLKVDAYFKNNGFSKKANAAFIFKNLFFLSLAIVSYVAIVSGAIQGAWLYPLFIFFGLSITIFLFSVAHDASHNAVSEKHWINRLHAYVWNAIGITCYFWELKHNIAHHGFTNVPGKDDDIDQSKLIRLNPKTPRKWFQKWQHIYGPFLYALLSINIIYIRDFQLLFQKKFGNKTVEKHPFKEVIILFITKIIFILYMIIIPKYALGVSWGQILLLHFTMHFAIGLFIGFILVPVHVTYESEYRIPDKNGVVQSCWGQHQIEATVDFAANNYFVNFISGGLNTHVAHHLFPNINHIHYFAITKIIQQTALEHGVPYRNRSLVEILTEHMRFLKALGNEDNPTHNHDFDVVKAA